MLQNWFFASRLYSTQIESFSASVLLTLANYRRVERPEMWCNLRSFPKKTRSLLQLNVDHILNRKMWNSQPPLHLTRTQEHPRKCDCHGNISLIPQPNCKRLKLVGIEKSLPLPLAILIGLLNEKTLVIRSSGIITENLIRFGRLNSKHGHRAPF